MYNERSLGVRLSLITSFGQAAKAATEELQKIVGGINEVKQAGKQFDLTGLKSMQDQLAGLSTKAKAAADSIRGLNSTLTPLAEKSIAAAAGLERLQSAISGAGSKASFATPYVNTLAKSAADVSTATTKAAKDTERLGKSTTQVATEAKTATEALLRLTSSATLIGDAAVPVNRFGSALIGAARESWNATSAVMALEAAIFRLPSFKQVRIEVLTGGIAPGYGGPIPITGGFRGGISSGQPMPSGTSGPYAALPSGGGGGGGIPIGGGATYFPPGGGGGGPGGGGTPVRVVNWSGLASSLGSGMMSQGNQLSHAGNNMFWGGFSGVMVASMVGAPLIGAAKAATDLDDMLHLTYEALAHGGMTISNAKNFSDRLAKLPQTIGGDYRENIAGIYPFVSSLPTFQAGLNLNDPKTQEKLIGMYSAISKLRQVDVASGAPGVDQYQMALDVAATAKNLGFKMGNIDEAQKAYLDAANVLASIKNKTGSTAAQAALAFRQVGVIASNEGIDPQEIESMVAILAENKIFAGQAGNQLRRILSRQAMTPAAVLKLQSAISDATGGKFNLSMYDAKGHQKGINDLIAQIATVEAQGNFGGPISDQHRGKIEGTLAGLYAGPALGSIVRFAAQTAAKDGKPVTEADVKKMLADYAQYMKTLPKDARPGESFVDYTTRIRQDNNVKTEVQKLDAKYLDQLRHTFEILKPDIIWFLKGIEGLIGSFGRLSDPTQAFIVKGLAMGAMIAGTVGVVGMLGGSFLKLAGGLEWILGFFIKGIPAVLAFGANFPKLAIVVQAFGATLLGIPVVGWILALVAAGALLYVAWAHDWLGIRETVGGALQWLGKEFEAAKRWVSDMVNAWKAGKFTEALGESIGHGLVLFSNFFKKTVDGVEDLGIKIAVAVAGWGSDHISKWWQAEVAKLSVTNYLTKWWAEEKAKFSAEIAKSVPEIAHDLGMMMQHAILQAMGMGSLESALLWGENLGNNIKRGIMHSTNGMAQEVRAQYNAQFAASQPISVLAGTGGAATVDWMHPNARPRGAPVGPTVARAAQLFPAQPDPVQTAAAYSGGASLANSNVDGAMDGLAKGKPKVAKAAKEVADVMLSITGHPPPAAAKNPTVEAIETLARSIEATLKAHGAKIKEQWIDLFDPNSGAVLARIKGNVGAFKDAINALAKRDANAFQPVEDAGKKMLDSLKKLSTLTDQDIQDFKDKILSFETSKMSAHVKAQIEHFAEVGVTALQAAQRRLEAALKAFSSVFTKDEASLDKSFAGTDKEGGHFTAVAGRADQRIANMVQMQKNPEVASLSELNAQRNIEQTALYELNNLLQTEITNRDTLAAKIEQMSQDIDNAVPKNEAERQALADAQEQLKGYKEQLAVLNSNLETQSATIDKVTKSIDAYNKKIIEARSGTSEWGKLLSDSFSKSVKAASDQMIQAANNAVDSFVNKMVGITSKSGPLQNALATFIKTFITNILDTILNNAIQGFQNALSGIGSGGSGGSGGGGIFDWMSKLFGLPNMTSSSSSATPVNLIPQSGSTDLGQSIANNTQKTSDGVAAVTGGSVGGVEASQVQGALSGMPGASGSAASSLASLSPFIAIELFNMALGNELGAAKGGSHSIWGTIGGALFGTVGAFIGSMFGGGATPATSPDIFDTQNYGQITSNLLGAQAGANGQTFYPGPNWVNQMKASGAKTGVGAIQMWLAQQNPNNPPPGVSQAQWAAELATWTTQFGSDPTGAGQLTHPDPSNIGIEKIVDPNAKGGNTNQSYTDLGNSMSTIMKMMQATAAAALQAQQNADQLAASFTTLLLNGPAGFMFPGYLGGANRFGNAGRLSNFVMGPGRGVGGSGSGTGGGIGHKPGNQSGGSVHGGDNGGANGNIIIRILDNVSHISGDPASIKQAIHESMPMIIDGVAEGQFKRMRTRPDYQSVTS